MRTMPAYLIRHAWQILFVAVALLAAWIGSQYHPAAGLALDDRTPQLDDLFRCRRRSEAGQAFAHHHRQRVG